MFAHMYVYVPCVHKDQKRASDLQEPELRLVVSHIVVLGTEPGLLSVLVPSELSL